MIPLNSVHNEDCLGSNGMILIPDHSIDMILCDLPYGTTQNKWDSVIDLHSLWKQYRRIIKANGAIVLTAQPPFDKVLGMSNLGWLKYEWVWEKNVPSGFLNAKKQPLKAHENILVFYQQQCTFNPIKEPRKGQGKDRVKYVVNGAFVASENYGSYEGVSKMLDEQSYPKTVKQFNVERGLHPTQKPVSLFEYLIRTYTNAGETVLDNCMGSGTTAIACINTGRNYIGFEKEEKYYLLIQERIRKHTREPLFDQTPIKLEQGSIFG